MESYRPILAAGLVFTILGVAGCRTSTELDGQIQRRVDAAGSAAKGVSAMTLNDAARAPAAQFAPLETNAVLDLRTAQQLAVRYSRTMQSKRDQLRVAALAALSAERNVAFLPSGTLDYVMNRAEEETDRSATLRLQATRVLPSGGALTLRGESGLAVAGGVTNAAGMTYTSLAGISLHQPLLAGAGYEASHESLTQAERSLVYSLRSFALERQDFAIGILRSFYGLLTQRQVLKNTRSNAEQATFLRRRSEALFRIRRAPAVDVMRSQQQELAASNRLALAESEFDIAVRRFLVDLGVSAPAQPALEGGVPPIRPIGIPPAAAERLAFENRLDLLTLRDQEEDAKRRLRLARQALDPELNADAGAELSGSSTEGAFRGMDTSHRLSAGLSLTLPLDRRPEREAVKNAEIAATQAARAVADKEESIRLGIMEGYRRLSVLQQSAAIQRDNMELAERRAAYASLRFKNGELSNRDVVEAEDELLDARNAYANALVDYELQRVGLLRDMGTMDVAADGALIESNGRPGATPSAGQRDGASQRGG